MPVAVACASGGIDSQYICGVETRPEVGLYVPRLTEVSHHRHVDVGEENVRRFDVEVDDLRLVNFLDAGQNSDADALHLAQS